VQFYLGLPIAMILLSATVVPFFHRARIYTAYEYLERRFDVRVRTLTALLFLVGRAMSLGVTLAAPAVVIAAILAWPLPVPGLVIGVLVFVFYIFQTPPMLFNRAHDAQVAAGPRAAEYAGLERQFAAAFELRRQAAAAGERAAFLAADERVRAIRARAAAIIKETTGDERYNDVNYVFPTFITTRMPIGLVGL